MEEQAEANGRRLRPLLLAGLAVLLLLAAAGWVLLVFVPGRIEAAVERRLVRGAGRAGLSASVEAVRFHYTRPLQIRGLRLSHPSGTAFEAAEVLVGWSLRGEGALGRVRTLAHHAARLKAPGELSADIADATWDAVLSRRGGVLRRRGKADRVGIRRVADGAFEVELDRLDLGALVRPARRGRLLVRLGAWSGRLGVSKVAAKLRLSALLRISGAQLPSVEALDVGEGDGEPNGEPPLGAPLDAEGTGDVEVDLASGTLDVACWRAEGRGLVASGSARMVVGHGDVWVDALFPSVRLELGRTLSVSGIPLPEELRSVGPDLGTVAFSGRVTALLSAPDSVVVEQKLSYEGPAEARRALASLNGPFVHAFEDADGKPRRILVSPESPDFVPLEGVPPVLLRALTLAEDADFWGHAGIDVGAIVHAAVTNLSRGEKRRGGSTISQQLAKNLFLSREKTYGRKLQELALAFLLEAAVPKRRILELYLNVIEWGPGVYGLGPASRHYFGKEPGQLAPREVAFLVTIIPGPRKYQRSIASGVLSPRFAAMVNRLLAKLRSVEALTEMEYAGAVGEELLFTEGSVGPAGPAVTGEEVEVPEPPPEEPPVAPLSG